MKLREIFLLAGAVLLLGVSATSAPASAASVRLPDCRFAGQTVTADLSASTPGNWTVNGPSGSSGPSQTTLSAWTAVSGYWMQPGTSSAANSSFAAGTYTYTIQFYIPCDPKNYTGLSLNGKFAADNSARLKVNNGAWTQCTGGNTCFNTPVNGTGFSAIGGTGPGDLHAGPNTITVEVTNNESYTGLAVKASLTARCGKECCVQLPRRGPGGMQDESSPEPSHQE